MRKVTTRKKSGTSNKSEHKSQSPQKQEITVNDALGKSLKKSAFFQRFSSDYMKGLDSLNISERDNENQNNTV